MAATDCECKLLSRATTINTTRPRSKAICKIYTRLRKHQATENTSRSQGSLHGASGSHPSATRRCGDSGTGRSCSRRELLRGQARQTARKATRNGAVDLDCARSALSTSAGLETERASRCADRGCRRRRCSIVSELGDLVKLRACGGLQNVDIRRAGEVRTQRTVATLFGIQH